MVTSQLVETLYTKATREKYFVARHIADKTLYHEAWY